MADFSAAGFPAESHRGQRAEGQGATRQRRYGKGGGMNARIALRACTQYNESTVRKPSGKRQVNLAIRLPLQKHRRFRAGVVEDGSSIQRVLENLIDRWIEERERGGSRIADLRGFLRGSDVLESRRAERQAELERDRSRL
jgi:hypothetical protein